MKEGPGDPKARATSMSDGDKRGKHEKHGYLVVDLGPPTIFFLWQMPHPLLWAVSRAARGKTTVK